MSSFVMFDMWKGDGTPAWSLLGDMQNCVIHAFEGREQGFKIFCFRICDDCGTEINEIGNEVFDILTECGIENGHDLNKWMEECRSKSGNPDTSDELMNILIGGWDE